MKFSLMAFVSLSILIFGVAACNSSPSTQKSSKPPHYGVFILENGRLVELPETQFTSIPLIRDLDNPPTTTNKLPAIVVWRSETNLDYLEFEAVQQYLGKKVTVQYNATPKDDGIIEIKPKNFLQAGFYCLIQGNPLAMFLPGFCFEVR